MIAEIMAAVVVLVMVVPTVPRKLTLLCQNASVVEASAISKGKYLCEQKAPP